MVEHIKGPQGPGAVPEHHNKSDYTLSPEGYKLPKHSQTEEKDLAQEKLIKSHAIAHSAVTEAEGLHGNGPLGVVAALSSQKFSHIVTQHGKELKNTFGQMAIYAMAVESKKYFD
jgi:hypothetical protein